MYTYMYLMFYSHASRNQDQMLDKLLSSLTWNENSPRTCVCLYYSCVWSGCIYGAHLNNDTPWWLCVNNMDHCLYSLSLTWCLQMELERQGWPAQGNWAVSCWWRPLESSDAPWWSFLCSHHLHFPHLRWRRTEPNLKCKNSGTQVCQDFYILLFSFLILFLHYLIT